MIVVAFYSTGTPYEHEAKLLRASLDKVGMNHRITGYPSRGDWYANTAFKPEAIREAREAVSGPMLYVDVDAFVHQNCADYFETLACDFAAHWFAGPAGGHNAADVCNCLRGMKCSREHRLLSGTLFFADSGGARRLIDDWCAMNKLFRERGLTQGGGQKNLWFLLTCKPDLRTTKLPGRYCYVFDKSFGYPQREPVTIEHTIASRDHRLGRARVTRARAVRKEQLLQLVGT